MVTKRTISRKKGKAFSTIMWLIVAALGLIGCGTGPDGEDLSFEATLAGRPVADSSPTDPIELHHEEITELSLLITNTSDRPVTVAHVRLEGELLDLIFLTYDTGIDETIEPAEQRIIRFPIDFFDLEGQAHGLLRARVRLFDAERTPLGAQDLFVDGRGSPFATTSVFTLALFGIAALSFVWNMHRLATRQLPADPLARGLRFVHTGLVSGLAISAAFSTLRIWPLPTYTWLLIVLVCAFGGFVAGYLSPGVDDEVQFPVINLTDTRGEPIRISNQ